MQEGTLSASGHPGVTERLPEWTRGDVFAAQCPTRQLLDRVGDKWSVLVLILLADRDCRFNELKRQVGGISQKMLSQTLRALERDGLVRRDVAPTMPVTVSYALTPLGADLIAALRLMIDWAETRMPDVVVARRRYDERATAT
ncbi:MAG: helix-turn-helix transcriptional regulator [Sphingomonas ginsenosidimutans]|nr:helix-turn-helix transcriptional regulator [Sphingomonas ginsenosidimutans]